MKYLIMSYVVLLFSLIVLTGCGQNDTKKKELELKERELALKEKEFALKEKGIHRTDSLVQKTTQLPNNPTTNPKTNILNEKQVIDNVGSKFLGLWKYNNTAFLKISKDKSGNYKFQNGFNDQNNDEKSIIWDTDDNVYPNFINGKLEAKYRMWEGSAFDAYSDIKFNIELKADNKLLLKNFIRTGGGNSYNESYEAVKIK